MTAGNVPSAQAVLFGSYLENYGQHHSWCVTLKPSTAPCNCGFDEALAAVARFHTTPQPSADEYEAMVRYWSARGGR